MLADLFRDSPAPLTIIDVRGSAVKDRLVSLGSAGRVEVFGPGTAPPVSAFTAWCRDEASTELRCRLHDPGIACRYDPMIVVWGQDASAAVTAVSEAGGRVRLTTGPISPTRQAAARPRDGLPPAVLPVLADIVRCPAAGSHLDVLTPDGTRRSIIGWLWPA